MDGPLVTTLRTAAFRPSVMRWHRADVACVHAPEAWLITTLTRLCLDRLRAARRERTAYAAWQSQLERASAASDAQTERVCELSRVWLSVRARLTPEERVALVLRDGFDRDQAAIGQGLAKSESACRQLLHRARERVRRDGASCERCPALRASREVS